MTALTEVDPGNKSVGIVTVFAITDVAETDEVQLLQARSAGRIDGKQDRPSYQAAEEAQRHGNLQIAEEEEAVQRVMIEDIAVRNLVERFDPTEQSPWQLWRSFSEGG